MILRTDTRVTNHGYVNGRANPIQTVLQAGTAVLVDRYGRPVVKCYCGNPVAPPVAYASPVYVGPLWAGFSTSHITIIIRSTTIMDTFTLWDPKTGKLFPRTPGPQGHDGPYIGPRTPTTPQPSQPGTTTTSTQSTAPSSPAENPSVGSEPFSVHQGEPVTISATGFAPGATLAITISGAASAQYSTAAGSDGTATYTLDTSGFPPGQYYVEVANTATGAHSHNAFVIYPAQQTTTTTASQTSTTPTETSTTESGIPAPP